MDVVVARAELIAHHTVLKPEPSTEEACKRLIEYANRIAEPKD